jgi:NADH-quinone oxidoreductase subunit N
MSNGLAGLDMISMLPVGIVVLGAIVCLMLEVFQRPSQPRTYLAGVAAATFALAGFISLKLAAFDGAWTFVGAGVFDSFGMTMSAIICLGGVLTALVSPGYLLRSGVDRGEYYALLLFAAAGMMVMVSSADLIIIFIGLEIQSVSAYALAGYLRRSSRSAEAGLKYFLLGAAASAIFLYGASMLYGATGSTFLPSIFEALNAGPGQGAANVSERALAGVLSAAQGVDPGGNALMFGSGSGPIPLPALGGLLIVVAFGAKLALVPFHAWAPDAYSGAPTPVSGYLAASIKAAGVATVARVLFTALWGDDARFGDFGWADILFWISLLSMVVGNLTALMQTSVKRMLAWSSVAHAGYLFAALAASGTAGGSIDSAASIVFYTFAYTVGTIGAFGVLAAFERSGQDVETFQDLNSLGTSHPWAAGAMAIFMLTAAGFPGTAGFIGKVYVFGDVLQAATGDSTRAMVMLGVVGLLSSVVGAAYYLRVIVHMYGRRPAHQIQPSYFPATKFAIVFAALVTLWVGFMPQSASDLAEQAASSLMGRADGAYVAPETAE